MTTIRKGFEAGIDAVIADNTLSRGDFSTAVRGVITDGLSSGDSNTWLDAIAAELNRLGIINNPTYNNMRGEIINSGKDTFLLLWDSIAGNIEVLPESQPPITRALLQSAREDRDNADAAITRMNVLISAEPPGAVGRIIKTEMRAGKKAIIQLKRDARDLIRNITGDADS